MTPASPPPERAVREPVEEPERPGGPASFRPRPRLRWLVVVLVIAVAAATVGVGEWTGWTFVRVGTGSSGPSWSQDCVGAPYFATTYLKAVVSEGSSPAWTTAFEQLGGSFSNWSGLCAHVNASVSVGDGYVPELAAKGPYFVASGAVPTPSDRSALGATVTVLPDLLTAVDVVYNDAGLPTNLRLSGAVLAAIYEGTITSWASPRIAELNPGADLPSELAIVPVHRSDAPSVNLAFTTFLAESNTTWNSSVGAGTSVNWPTGVAVTSPSTMAGEVASTPGSLGYLEGVDGQPSGLADALLLNPAGAYVAPQAVNVTDAAAVEAGLPPVADLNWSNLTTGVSIVDAPGSSSYPVVELEYVALYQDLGQAYSNALSVTNATWLLTFLWWSVTNASAAARALGLAPLPSSFERLAQRLLITETYNGIVLI